MPEEIIDFMGSGLQVAQMGRKHEDAKPLKGFGGADVLELITMDASGTYRGVYTVKMKDVVFVLHVFQKKSKHGIATPQSDIELIKSRLKQAEQMYKESVKK